MRSPYYTSEKEKIELREKRDAFTFDAAPGVSNRVVLVSGPEGVGKTHLVCTMATVNPVYILDTEYRAPAVIKRFGETTHPIKFKTVRSYRELVIAVKAILKKEPPGTIAIDSGSDLQIFAEIEYCYREGKEKVGFTFNWSEVWGLCNALVDDIKFSPFNLVVTARMKDEYNGDKSTGKKIPRIYSTLPYKADLMVQYSSLAKPGIITKPQSLDGSVQEVGRKLTLPEIISLYEGK